MRTLKFIVEDQIIRPDPLCDFKNLVPGTEKYLRAEFNFSSNWNGYTKVVSFRSRLGFEYPAQVLRDGKTCMIPAEALKKRIFKIQVIGKTKDLKLATNKLAVHQNGGEV